MGNSAPIGDAATVAPGVLGERNPFGFCSSRPHGVTWITPAMQVASLDHAMWIHRPFRADEWRMHVIDSPSAQGARGLVRGRVFGRAGASWRRPRKRGSFISARRRRDIAVISPAGVARR